MPSLLWKPWRDLLLIDRSRYFRPQRNQLKTSKLCSLSSRPKRFKPTHLSLSPYESLCVLVARPTILWHSYLYTARLATSQAVYAEPRVSEASEQPGDRPRMTHFSFADLKVLSPGHYRLHIDFNLGHPLGSAKDIGSWQSDVFEVYAAAD